MTDMAFSEIDLARAMLIRDLTEDLGVQEEGVDVILPLADQVHGLRQFISALRLMMPREQTLRPETPAPQSRCASTHEAAVH